eukprot:9273430-Pyramimonas_sp.AAC.1
MAAKRYQFSSDGLPFVGKDGVVHYNGYPAYGEEFRATLSYHASEGQTPKFHAIKRAAIARQALLDRAGDDPLAAVRLVVATVRQACEWIAPLRRQQAFENLFFKGLRNISESVQGYISRRVTEYERLKSLSATATVNEDIRTCFLLKLANISMTEHKAII